jgi:hypothetical protein
VHRRPKSRTNIDSEHRTRFSQRNGAAAHAGGGIEESNCRARPNRSRACAGLPATPGAAALAGCRRGAARVPRTRAGARTRRPHALVVRRASPHNAACPRGSRALGGAARA